MSKPLVTDELWAVVRPLLPPEARPILTVVVVAIGPFLVSHPRRC